MGMYNLSGGGVRFIVGMVFNSSGRIVYFGTEYAFTQNLGSSPYMNQHKPEIDIVKYNSFINL